MRGGGRRTSELIISSSISHSSALHSETPAPCFWKHQQTVASNHLTGSSGHQIPASAFSAAPSALELRAARMRPAQTRSGRRRQAAGLTGGGSRSIGLALVCGLGVRRLSVGRCAGSCDGRKRRYGRALAVL